MSHPNRFSTRVMLPSDWPRIRHFKPSEFTRPEMLGFEFMLWLDELRARVGLPIVITSSYRSPEYNRSVGGAKDSAHTDVPCNSVDIGRRPRPDDPNWNYTRARIILTAAEMGCERFGIYANGSLHLDRCEKHRPAPRIWTVVDNPA